MFIALFTSESCDHYIIGPFKARPSTVEMLTLFNQSYPDEGAYLQEFIGGMTDYQPFQVLELTADPSVQTY